MTRTDFGSHYLIDFIDCDPEMIKFVEPARSIVVRALKECGATVIDQLFHQFEPFGVSGTVLIAESHAGFHSWPENNFAAVDIFTCGVMDPDIAIDIMKKEFRARAVSMKISVRGQLDRA